ncbi:hypothetical protein BD289DRAFT_132436, partial [Coniella lustricola]
MYKKATKMPDDTPSALGGSLVWPSTLPHCLSLLVLAVVCGTSCYLWASRRLSASCTLDVVQQQQQHHHHHHKTELLKPTTMGSQFDSSSSSSSSSITQPHPHPPFRVLVLGGAYGGLSAALSLLDLTEGRAARTGSGPAPDHEGGIPVDVTIVDERDGFCKWLSVILSSGHLVIWSSGHLVIWSSGHLVIWSSGHLVILLYLHRNHTHTHTHKQQGKQGE